MQVGDLIFLEGDGASPRGDRPFLDRFDVRTLDTERIFQCEGESHESVVAVLADNGRTLLTRYETTKQPPNYVVRDRITRAERWLTQFKDPAPQLAGVQREFITYARKDGVTLGGTLYLPPGYQKGQRLPLVMWAYPREFTDPALAGQVSGSPYRFTTYSGASHLFFLTQGYAVLDDPSMPIVGAGETANDTYVEQLVASAQAAIDKVVEMGVADPNRVGVGGHSYGAFMTAQPAGALAAVPRRHRAQRRLQPHADAVRVPERTADVLGGPRHLREDVAVLVRECREGPDPADPRRG